jgi:hypothetical protein
MGLKDAKYLVGCRGTESRNVALSLSLSLVWIECQLLAFTLRPGDKQNTKFELQIRTGCCGGSQIMGLEPARGRHVRQNYSKSVVYTNNFGKSLIFSVTSFRRNIPRFLPNFGGRGGGIRIISNCEHVVGLD